MNPLSLRAENFRSYSSIELDFPQGAIAISGPNGAGKSSLIAALDVALFGSRSLGDYLSDDADTTEMFVELVFEHAGEMYRVRRSYSAKGRGKSTTDLERHDTLDDFWTPLTRESQAATQEAIEEILGLSRETFHASALLMQGDSAAFTEAQPRERKAILAEVLGLSVWDRLRDAAGADRRHTERLASELAGRISLLEERGSDTAGLKAECSRLRSLVSDLESEHAAKTAALDAAAVAVQELERAEATYRECVVAVQAAQARLVERQAVVDRAAAAKLEAVEVEREVVGLPMPDALAVAETEFRQVREQIVAEESAESEYALAVHRHRDAVMKRNELLGRASAMNEEAHDLRLNAEHALAHVGEARCDVCEQILGKEAAEATAKRYREQAETLDFSARELDREANAVEIPEPGDPPLRDGFLLARSIDLEPKIGQLREQLAQRWRLEERLAGLARTIDEVTPELTAEVALLATALVDAQAALDEISEPEPGALEQAQATAIAARELVAQVVARITQTQAELARADAALEQAQGLAEELSTARARQEALLGELDLLTTLERAYGRDGIPSLIVEAQAIPSIEAEASRILSELGTSYRVELRTQRALKSGDGLADTLDVVVIADAGERPYETFSGGERSRLNVALRIALARLLAHRRGAESRVLVLDEVEYLDSAGQMALAGVLIELARTEFDKVVCVSHADTLRDLFDTTIEISRDDGRSRIVADLEPVLA